MNNIFIPKTIRVGYQERSDTYTKKLAYVIYFDEKGKLRKEASWRSWCHLEDRYIDDYVRDSSGVAQVDSKGNYLIEKRLCHKNLGSDDYPNEPTEGFVLNKGVGGVRESYGWNTRNEYIRVWDPRGFEFEISIANLLYILQNTSSIKGKGLEGKFLYGWQGTDLVLIPENAPEFQEMQKFTEIQSGKIGKKDLTPGWKYLTKKNEEVTYLGVFPAYHERYTIQAYVELKNKKQYWFTRGTSFAHHSSISFLAKRLEQNSDYPFLMDKLESDKRYNPINVVSIQEVDEQYIKDHDLKVFFIQTKNYFCECQKADYTGHSIGGLFSKYSIRYMKNKDEWQNGSYGRHFYSYYSENQIREELTQNNLIYYKPIIIRLNGKEIE